MIYENQRLPTSKKNKQWRKEMMDYYCNVADDFYLDWYRIEENYALKNNQLNQEEYRDICKGLGGDKEGRMFVDAYNKTHTVIEAMKGEEWNRPFSFDVINNSPRIINRIERDKKREIDALIDKVFEIELQKQQEIIKAEIEANKKNLDEKQLKQLTEEIQSKYAEKYKNLANPKAIFDKYKNITTLEEITVSRLMKMMSNKLNIKTIKNRTYEDALLAGTEILEIRILRTGDLPRIKQINPINAFYEKSPDVEYIQNGDYAGYKEHLTIGKVIQDYGHLLNKKDYDKLTSMGMHKGVSGLNHPFSTNRGAPSQWKEVQRTGRFPSGKRLNAEDYIILDEKYGGPTNGYISSKYIDSLGLSASETRRNYSEYLSVYTVYWRSQRRIGKLQYINDYGEKDETFVDEEFVIPADAKKETTSQMFAKNTIEYTWIDDDDKPYSLEWIWVDEVWKGTRIGSDIYVNLGPLEHAYQSLLDPYEVKLPIYGYIYNNRNAFSISVMDRMKPWQKLYYVIMSRFLKLITQDRGVLTFLNVHLFDKNLGVEKTLQIAEDQGIILYNPMSNSKGAGGYGTMNTMKVAEKVDATNSNVINHYINILQFIEANIKLAAGMSDQRIAQSNPRMTATDNYRETMHSVNMSEPLNAAHDLLWEDILQGLMEMTLSVLKNNTGKLRGFLSDEERAIIDLDLIDLNDNYNLKIADNSKAFRILEQSKQLAHALVQNDKASMSQLIELMRTENLSEFQTMISEIEKEHEALTDQRQQSQQEHEKEMMNMQLKAKEDDQMQELDKTYLKGMMDYYRDEMKAKYQAMSFDAQKDYNRDGIPDYMQIQEFKEKAELERMKLLQKERELDIKEKEISQKTTDKLIDVSIEEERMKKDSDSKAKERAMKLQMEKMKSSMKGKQT